MKKLVCFVAAILVVCIPVVVHAWGVEGHQVVGTLAQSMLSDKAKAGVASVLGPTDTLASVANWADQVRFGSMPESYNWHFVDIPLSASGFSDARDCFLPADTHPGAATDHMNCVVDRITFFKQVLADTTKTPTERLNALRFVVHFVGDVHQPFHAVGDKRGANDIDITEFGQPNCGGTASNPKRCNLHGAWDTGLITHTGMDVNAYVAHLQSLIATNHLTATGTPEDWANESHAAGAAAWLDENGIVDEAYYNTNIQVVDKRLALAGLRLAALLEEVFNPASGGGTGTGTGMVAVASRNVNLRPDASTSHTPLETLHKGDQVTLLETAQTNGFYHVQAADGKQGWVYARYVKVQSH